MRLVSCSLFWTHAYKCTYTNIYTEWGNTVIHCHILLFCFSLHCQLKQLLACCGATVSLLSPREGKTPWKWQHLSALIAPGDFPSESVWDRHPGATSGTFFKTNPTRHWGCKPRWRCSWRLHCKAQRGWCTCVHSYGSQVLSKCPQQRWCRGNGIVWSYGCYFKADRLLACITLLAALEGLPLF